MRVASWIQASFISPILSLQNMMRVALPRGRWRPRLGRAEEASTGWWGGMRAVNRVGACREVATDARCVCSSLHAACRQKVLIYRACRARGPCRRGPQLRPHPGKSLGEPETWGTVSEGNTGSMETEVETLPVAAGEARTRPGMRFLQSRRMLPARFLRPREGANHAPMKV